MFVFSRWVYDAGGNCWGVVLIVNLGFFFGWGAFGVIDCG